MKSSYAREMSAWEQPILPPITGCATAVFTGPQFNASGNVWNCDSGTACAHASKSYMYDVHIPVDPCKIQLSFASCKKVDALQYGVVCVVVVTVVVRVHLGGESRLLGYSVTLSGSAQTDDNSDLSSDCADGYRCHDLVLLVCFLETKLLIMPLLYILPQVFMISARS